MSSARLDLFFRKYGRRVNHALNAWLPKTTSKPSVIHQAVRYSVNAGGKRLRPILVIAAAEACGGKAETVMPVACAMELIHTYSLVHDDLPAMDDDDLRRGMPTNHKVFGEDIAILAGDALLTQAFALIGKNGSIKGVRAKSIIDVLHIITTGAGVFGMIGGQVADIKSDKGRWKKRKDPQFSSSKRLLTFIHLNKTAALIRASLLAGGRLAGGSKMQLEALNNYGKHIGLAFQITDDILDQIGDKKKLGKKGSDKANQKLTYPAIYGLTASQKMALQHIRKAHLALHRFKKKAALLHDLADYILHRDH